MARKFLVSRVALAVALASGVAVAVVPGTAVAAKKEKKASAAKYSPEFMKVAGPIQTAMGSATQGLSGNIGDAQLQAAKAKFDAAVGGDGKAAFTAAEAAATTPDDKMALGSFIRNYGLISQDKAMMLKGLNMSISSGALPAAELGKTNFDAGVTAYQLKDYAQAATYLKAAKDGGYVDPQNQLDAVLADSYRRSNNPAAAAQLTQDELARAKAAGTKPSETTIRTALQSAYDAKQVGPATDLAIQLAEGYPSTSSWQAALQVTRALNQLNPQEDLDLMRLMARTGSMSTRSDYLSYIQDADPRRLPAESLKIIDQGVSSGKLSAADAAEYRGIAQGRVSADRAALPSYEKDARVGSAPFQTINGAADAHLSNGVPAKAEELYKLALPKAGGEKDRVLTRMGIAQADQGKYAEAQSTFAQVTGNRAPVAKMWAAYAKSKANPAAPTSAAPAAPAAAPTS
jgi:hypothetical protein